MDVVYKCISNLWAKPLRRWCSVPGCEKRRSVCRLAFLSSLSVFSPVYHHIVEDILHCQSRCFTLFDIYTLYKQLNRTLDGCHHWRPQCAKRWKEEFYIVSVKACVCVCVLTHTVYVARAKRGKRMVLETGKEGQWVKGVLMPRLSSPTNHLPSAAPPTSHTYAITCTPHVYSNLDRWRERATCTRMNLSDSHREGHSVFAHRRTSSSFIRSFMYVLCWVSRVCTHAR